MGLFEAFLEFLRGLFGQPGPEPEPDPQPDSPEPVSPLTFTGNSDATRLDVKVYQTAALADRRGQTPEHDAVRVLAQAAREAGYNHAYEFGLDGVTPPEEAATLEMLNWWSSHAPTQRGETDLHILLMDIPGNGIAFHGESNTRSGRYAIAPGRHLDELVELTEVAPPEWDVDKPNLWTNLVAGVHEQGHTLGGRHRDNMMEPPSLLYREPGEWADAPAP